MPRLQSVYLLAVAVAGTVIFFSPVSTIKITPSGFEDSKTRIIEVTAFGKTEITDGAVSDAGKNKLLPVSIILSVIVALVSLFLFRKREVQIKLCGLNYIFICTTLVLTFFYCDIQSASKNIMSNVDYHAGALMPFVQLLGNFLSLRNIRKT